MNLATKTFIHENLSSKLLPLLDITLGENVCPVSVMLSTKVNMHTKDSKCTFKQKDTFFIIQEGKSIVLGDIKLPKVKGVNVLDPSIKRDGWHLIAQFLIDDYDMNSPLVVINQSKAEKTNDFKLSNGSVVHINGQINLRVNIRQCKNIAPILKASGIKGSQFNQLCKLAFLQASREKSEKHKKQLDTLIEKYPAIEAIVYADLLPIYFSDEMTLINFYLREGK